MYYLFILLLLVFIFIYLFTILLTNYKDYKNIKKILENIRYSYNQIGKDKIEKNINKFFNKLIKKEKDNQKKYILEEIKVEVLLFCQYNFIGSIILENNIYNRKQIFKLLKQLYQFILNNI